MRLPIVLTFLLLPLWASALPSDEGMFAVFETNHGSFTCELFYEEVPMVVANFVGLAEGSQAWMDLETGTVERRPFYDGLTFHRVISGFMVQSGSPNGEGTDGPGYRFPDQFYPGLVHGEAGILSMANSGVDTNGSQFFITLAPTEWLDYKHAVFGRIVEGMDVVEAIGDVETESNDRPAESVVIHSVEILRHGADAENFAVRAYGLPVVRETPARLEQEADELSVRFPREPVRSYALSYSADLSSWSAANLAASGEGEGEALFEVTELASGLDRQFYRVAEIDNSPVPEAYFPESLVGKTLDLDVVSAGLRLVLRPDDERTDDNEDQAWLGTGDFNEDEDLNLDYIWFQEGSRGVIFFVLEGFVQFDLNLLFIDEESGTFSGVARTGDQPPPEVRGVFTLSDRESETSTVD